ncbi:MAG: hypothetical protein GX589_00310 [Deltaproteobacteria bacterium]|nr:hypothetical protein [Deltaproteobacteria bacterium]
MASDEEKDQELEGQEGEAKPAKSKKKLIIIVAAVLLVVVLGLVGFMFLGGKEEGSAEGESGQEEVEHEMAHVEMKPFVVNLSSTTNYLKVVLVLEYDPVIAAGPAGSHGAGGEGGGDGHGGGDAAGPTLPGVLGAREAMINDSIIKVLSSKTAETVLSLDGKEELKEELIEAINEASGLDDAPITNIYFQDFITQ